jgi:hypothetical protein
MWANDFEKFNVKLIYAIMCGNGAGREGWEGVSVLTLTV